MILLRRLNGSEFGINADLIATVDVPTTVAGLAPRLVPLLSDGAMITLLDPTGAWRDASHAHRDQLVSAALRRQLRTGAGPIPPAVVLDEVLATGTAVRPPTAGGAATGGGRDTLPELDDSWSLHLPVRNRTDVLGVLTLWFTAGREPDPADEVTLAEIASRIAQALDNARLLGAQDVPLAALGQVELGQHEPVPGAGHGVEAFP